MSRERDVFKYRLSTLHIESKISRKQAASDLGILPSTYVNYFHGTIPTLETLTEIANYFNTTVDYLIGRTEERKRP